jgi:hypothetical protein
MTIVRSRQGVPEKDPDGNGKIYLRQGGFFDGTWGVGSRCLSLRVWYDLWMGDLNVQLGCEPELQSPGRVSSGTSQVIDPDWRRSPR